MKKWHGDRGNHVEPKIKVMNLDFAVNIIIYGGAQLRVIVELFSIARLFFHTCRNQKRFQFCCGG